MMYLACLDHSKPAYVFVGSGLSLVPIASDGIAAEPDENKFSNDLQIKSGLDSDQSSITTLIVFWHTVIVETSLTW